MGGAAAPLACGSARAAHRGRLGGIGVRLGVEGGGQGRHPLGISPQLSLQPSHVALREPCEGLEAVAFDVLVELGLGVAPKGPVVLVTPWPVLGTAERPQHANDREPPLGERSSKLDRREGLVRVEAGAGAVEGRGDQAVEQRQDVADLVAVVLVERGGVGGLAVSVQLLLSSEPLPVVQELGATEHQAVNREPMFDRLAQ